VINQDPVGFSAVLECLDDICQGFQVHDIWCYDYSPDADLRTAPYRPRIFGRQDELEGSLVRESAGIFLLHRPKNVFNLGCK
jgi:hypothetical protein